MDCRALEEKVEKEVEKANRPTALGHDHQSHDFARFGDRLIRRHFAINVHADGKKLGFFETEKEAKEWAKEVIKDESENAKENEADQEELGDTEQGTEIRSALSSPNSFYLPFLNPTRSSAEELLLLQLAPAAPLELCVNKRLAEKQYRQSAKQNTVKIRRGGHAVGKTGEQKQQEPTPSGSAGVPILVPPCASRSRSLARTRKRAQKVIKVLCCQS